MPRYKEGPNWNGTSWNVDAQRDDENHESNVDFAEVCRLIGTAVAVFPGAPIAGAGGAELNAFKTALLSVDQEITVVKGIHMRDSDPHIRASINNAGATYNYHVNLRPGTRTRLSASGNQVAAKNSRFVWEVTQVSVKVDGLVYKYPIADPASAPGNRRRGYSFTQGQMANHIAAAQAAIAEREAVRAAQEAQEAAAAAIRSQQAEQERRARVAAGKNPWGV